jgi:predicted ribosomally synthesized peptide with SipW-like signal peptide
VRRTHDKEGSNTMRKKTKGWIAAGLGGALLLGTGGTFALWSDTHTVSGGSVDVGHLRIDGANALTWDRTMLSPGAEVATGTLTFSTDVLGVQGGDLEVERDGGPVVHPGVAVDWSLDRDEVPAGPDSTNVTFTVTVTLNGDATNEGIDSVELGDFVITLTQQAWPS